MQTWQADNNKVCAHFNADFSGDVVFQTETTALAVPGDELVALIVRECVIPRLQKKFDKTPIEAKRSVLCNTR